MYAAGVVADHPAERAVRVRGRIGTKCERVLFGSVAETVFPGSARALACYFRRLAEMLFYSTKESRWRGANDSTRGACAPRI